MTEEQLLQQIALSPFDTEPRQVYADFLAEQGDPRAEVIALSARGSLTMAERRRVAGIVKDHSRRWLGPLEAIADPAGSHFVGGFLETLVLAFNARPAELLALRGEPRLATVRNLEAAVHRRPEALASFLRQPMLSNVTRLVLASSALPALEGVPPPFTLDALGIADNGLFVECLRPLERIPWVRTVPRWELVSSVLFASLHALEAFHSLRPQLELCSPIPELRMIVPYGVFEGVATWLCLPASERFELTQRWPAGQRWSIRSPGLLFTLSRTEDTGWRRLDVQIEGEAMRELDDRLSRLASVMVLLGPAALETVDVAVPVGLNVTRAHRHALKSASKRLRGVSVTFAGEPLSP